MIRKYILNVIDPRFKIVKWKPTLSDHFQKSNRKIVDRGNIDIPNTNTWPADIPVLVEELPYKSGSFKLVLWAQTFRVAINRYVQIFESQISVWGHDIEKP